MVIYTALSDGLIQVRVADDVADMVREWLPSSARRVDASAGDVRIDVAPVGTFGVSVPAGVGARVARIGDAELHVIGADAWVHGPGVMAHIELERGHAFVELGACAKDDMFAALNFATALLLARRGRYLLHCAAVQASDGGVWLLAGDSGAGKTSTALGLARTGFGLLSDDHIVLYRDAHVWHVEGWPRLLHPDAGWREGVLAGTRVAVDPDVERDIGRASSGPLTLILLPHIESGLEWTKVAGASQAEALSMMMRQTAWSLADPAVAPAALTDLADAAALPALAIRLAPDTFRDPALLAELVRAAT